ncbi:MAG: hypothetical protein WD872_10555 [Pirellulaceae bacterium]
MAVAAGACVGCGGEEWHAETYPARGRITINGAAPAGAVVELQATGEAADVRNSRPWAVVQDDGSYTLSTYEIGDGAPAGEYAISIKWPPDVSKPSLADRLGNAYSNPSGSQWKATVSAGENQLPLIEIVGAKVLSKEQAATPRNAPPGPGMGGSNP